MHSSSVRTMSLVAACGTIASVASAQPFLLNGSGATLQEAIFNAPASTNDFLDVDNDGYFTPIVDQLAPFDAEPPFLNDPTIPGLNQRWQLTYRVVGSGNGLAELVAWGGPGVFAQGEDGDPANGTLYCEFVDSALFNRTEFCDGDGPTSPIYQPVNPGGIPFRSSIASYPQVDANNDLVASGIRIDFAALDVPVSWATTIISEGEGAAPESNPGQTGYGDNTRLAVNKDGSLTGDEKSPPQDNKLEDLGTLNTNEDDPDQFTVFDTRFVLTPIAPIVNFGVGMEEILMSDLRHLSATGRRINGENLTKVTRDSGSGTRNGFMNAICLDPSWGVGENIGARTTSSANDLVGPDYQPSNKGGSSRNEGTTINTRLGVGHTGAERGESKGWLTGGQAEILAVVSDLKGGTVAARPTLENVLFNDENGFTIITPAVIATVGDPRNELMTGGEPGNTNPAPQNPEAAAFLNNITRSTEAFVDVPGGDESLFSPGEFLATQFLLIGAAEFVPNTFDPCLLDPNPALNTDLQEFILNDSGNVLGLPDFATYNQESAGLVPTRTTNVDYGDGAVGDTYVTQDGSPLAYGSMLNMRNKIAGDFNGDGARTIDDFADMVAAYVQRQGGDTWDAPAGLGEPGGMACIEILGDHNNDGMLTIADLRYAADGLAIVSSCLADCDANGELNILDFVCFQAKFQAGDPSADCNADGVLNILDFVCYQNAFQVGCPEGEGEGVLSRKAGFVEMDEAFGGNLFETQPFSTGKAYASGDSRGDVAGPDVVFDAEAGQWLGVARGWEPIGADGFVDASDIDYVCAQFTNNPFVVDGEATWSDLDEAVGFDLSCDMNGDLVVNSADVAEIVQVILGTSFGDVNLDGIVDEVDLGIAEGNLGEMGGWADGDMNCDGMVTQADIDIING